MRSIASRRAHAARAPHASRRTLRVLLSMTQAAKVGTTHGSVTLRSDAKHRVSKGRQSSVTLRSDAKHRVSKGARCACSSCFETHAARAPQHDTGCEGRHYAWHRHPEERCEASRLEGRTLRVLLMLRDARCACSSA